LAHFRFANLSLHKRDWHFTNTETGLQRPPREIDLKAVARGFDLIQIQRLQGAGAKGSVSASGIVNINTEGQSGVCASTA
jgi:hypothetical protein